MSIVSCGKTWVGSIILCIADNGEVKDDVFHILNMTCDWDNLEKNDCITNNWYIP